MIGTAIAQLIAIGFQLITRRLYTPEDFGAFALYFSIINVLFSLASLQLNRAVFLPKNPKDTHNLVMLAIKSVSIISLIVFIVFILAGQYIRTWLKFPVEYKAWFYLIPLTVLIFASFDIFNYYLIREKSFKASMFAKIIRRTTEGSMQSGLGLINQFGLFIGDLAAHCVNLIYTISISIKKGFLFKNYDSHKSRQLFKEYSDFPKYSTVPTVLNTISLFFPIIIVNKLFSTEITGQLDLARMVLSVPLALISTSVFQVLLQKTSESAREKQAVSADIIKVGSILFLLSITGIILLKIFAEPLFSIFGGQWSTATDISKILIFSYAIKFVVSPLSSVFTSLNKISIASIWQIFYFSILISLFFIPFDSITDFIKKLVIIDLSSYFIYLVLISAVVINYEKKQKPASKT